MPTMARVARTESAPLAVRLRRRKRFGALPRGATDSTESGLTPSDKDTYVRLKAIGNIRKNTTEEQYIESKNERRSRIRGFRSAVRNGSVEAEVVGQRVYLPNIIMRLVRNQTAPGQPYNPYEATFRLPQSVTKTDIRSLLLAVYGVKTTYIRTDNYISPWYRTMKGPQRRSYKTYKRAVVGLVEPFYYPHRMEDMEPEERKLREEWIEKNFAIQHQRNLQKEEMLRMTKGQGRMSWKFNAPYATKRSHIIRLVNERREARENLVSGFAREMKALRQTGEHVTYKAVRDKVKPPKDSQATDSPELSSSS